MADRVPARVTPHRTPEFVDLGALEDLGAPMPRDNAPRPAWNSAWNWVVTWSCT